MRVYILCAIILIVAFLQGCGYADETLAAEHYASMVCSGAWPDFKHIKPDCEVTPNPRPERY